MLLAYDTAVCARLILMLLTICKMETSSNYVSVYHKLSDQAKIWRFLTPWPSLVSMNKL